MVNKLEQIAEKRGETLDKLIPRLIQQEGSPHKVAAVLDVAPNTIRYWLVRHGYECIETRRFEWVKREAATK